MDFTVVVIVFLCAVIIVMSAFLAQALSKLKETEEYYNDLHERHQRKTAQLTKQNKEIYALWAEIEDIKKENLKLQENNVSRETTYNKSYGLPEVVDYFNARYPGEEPK